MYKNIYDGVASRVLPHRPFFTIVIPCYNSGKTLGDLLQSIVDQDLPDDIEVILSDDHSTESYQDVVDQFTDKLCIRQVQTEYNFAPGNTRERGAIEATGQWLAFADHDDIYFPHTLGLIKDQILAHGEQYYAIANFVEANPDTGEVIREMRATRNWNHAKFYNVDNLWRAYNIHFKKDLLTHEDIYVSSCINCAMQAINGDNPLYIDIFCYIWNNRPTTISRERYGNHPFLEVFYGDYIKSTARVYVDNYVEGKLDYYYCLTSALDCLLYCYFYTESFKFHNPDDYLTENDDYTRELLVDIKQIFGVDNDYIWNYAAAEDAVNYSTIREMAAMGAGPNVASRTLRQWLDYLHADIKPRITMSDAMHK